MKLRNLAGPLLVAGALTLPGDLNEKTEHGAEDDRTVAAARDSVNGMTAAASDPDTVGDDTLDSGVNTGPDPEAFIAKLKKECPDPWAMIQNTDPELYKFVETQHPQIMKADLFGGIIDFGIDAFMWLFDQFGLQGTIVIIILMNIFGVVPVLKTAGKGVKWGFNQLTGMGGDKKELGEAIPKGQLPSLKTVLSEIVINPQQALDALDPVSRAALTDHYAFVTGRFDVLRFEDRAEGIDLFKLAIKARYLDLRIAQLQTELGTAEAVAAGRRATLERELEQLTTLQGTTMQHAADNPLNILSVRKNAAGRLTNALRGRVRALMGAAGRNGRDIRHAEEATKVLVRVPRLYKIEGTLRQIRILEQKLKLWEGRYNNCIAIAGHTVAAPGPEATVAEHQRYAGAQAFIATYEGMQQSLRNLLEERGRIQRAAHAVEGVLPVSPGRRALVMGLGKAGAVYGGYWAIRGAVAGVIAISNLIDPPEPPKPEEPSKAQVAQDELDKAAADKAQAERETGQGQMDAQKEELKRELEGKITAKEAEAATKRTEADADTSAQKSKKEAEAEVLDAETELLKAQLEFLKTDTPATRAAVKEKRVTLANKRAALLKLTLPANSDKNADGANEEPVSPRTEEPVDDGSTNKFKGSTDMENVRKGLHE